MGNMFMKYRMLFFLFAIISFIISPAYADDEENLRNLLEKWRTSWEHIEFEPYIQMYSRSFKSGNLDYDGWIKRKETLFKKSGKLKIMVRNVMVSVEGNTAVAKFLQFYESDTLKNNIGQKELQFRKENNDWKILSESWEPVAQPSIFFTMMKEENKKGAAVEDTKKAIEKSAPVKENGDDTKAVDDNKINGSIDDNVEVRHINFEIEDDKESVYIDLNGYAKPQIYSIDGGEPRVVIDFKNVKTWAGNTKIPVNGKFIKQIRIYLNQNSETLRAILDLEPMVDIMPKSDYYQTENIFSMVFKKKTITSSEKPDRLDKFRMLFLYVALKSGT